MALHTPYTMNGMHPNSNSNPSMNFSTVPIFYPFFFSKTSVSFIYFQIYGADGSLLRAESRRGRGKGRGGGAVSFL